ncbi:F0F1 ATP synthase subunit B [Pontiella sp.]|uniref:F0F1 ATP synthase subunit B n=1 Tax=Pontiella sp. TaxID=2837462 RepID=UPI003569374B
MADSAHNSEQSKGLAQVIESHAVHEGDHHGEVNPMEISGGMVIWTWVLFAITLLALYKIAWKPILGALDKREEEIQESIDNAEKLRREIDGLEAFKAEKIGQAEDEAKAIMETGRKAAHEQARVIQEKAQDEALILTENAHRDIESSRATAEEALRIESAQWARELAGKLIDANLDDEKNRALTDKLIQEL